MGYPKEDKRLKLKVCVSKKGVNFYGNNQAFKTLARRFELMADSDPKDYYHFHLCLEFNPFEYSRNGKNQRVWIYKNNRKVKFSEQDYEITFLNVQEKDFKGKVFKKLI